MSRLYSSVHVVVLLLLVGTPAAGWALTAEEAREAEYEGRWDDAVAAWQTLALDAELQGDPVRERSVLRDYLRTLYVLRNLEDLEREAQRAAGRHPGWVDAMLYWARALEHQGRVEEAITLLAPSAGRSFPAAAAQARLLQRLGRREDAAVIHAALVEADRPGATLSPQDRAALADAASATGDFQRAANLYELAYQDSVDYLDARIALTYLFQEKYQAQLAAEELNQAGQLSPYHPDLQLARAELLMLNNQLRRAEDSAESVLEIREDADARVVLARLANVADRPASALEQLQGVLTANPGHLNARYQSVVAHYLAGDTTAYRQELAGILEIDPDNVDVFLELGDILEMGRRNREAFAMYGRVLEIDPDHPRALIDTGLLHMREGNEIEARGLLERGFEGDPFNIRAYNQLELLDEMDTFARYQTPNFEIRLDADEDSVLVPLLQQSLEDIFEELTDLHGARPRNRTIVEVFPTHSWFSARVTGLPWIGNIPAVCFGDVVAMDSPRILAGNSNWREILRHEFGHVLALDMTDKKVPFWFTEGLSVYLEQYPRGISWDQNLKAAYLDDQLVPVDSLTLAFTRPRDIHQRLLAYHEAGLILQDLVDRHGWDAVPRMLHAFGEGQSLAQAVESVLGETLEAFSARALAHVTGTAEALPVWPRADEERTARLAKAVEALPGDPYLLRELARAQIQTGLLEEASETAKKLLEASPEDPRAYTALGIADQVAGRGEASIRNLERAVAAGTRDLPALVTLAGLLEGEGDTLRALQLYGDAIDLYPYHTTALTRRAALFTAHGDSAAARDEYERLLSRTDSAGSAAVTLARLQLDDGDGDAAARTLDYAVGVFPTSADVEALRGQAYLLLDRDEEAYALFVRARRLDLRSVETMIGMATYYLKREDYEEAVYFAELALKYAPQHPVARRILTQAQEW